jgi:two-component system, NtrC family, sensor histidine kinase KinB
MLGRRGGMRGTGRPRSLWTLLQPSVVRPVLFALGVLVVAAFALYAHLVIRTLREDAQRVAHLYAERILPRFLAEPGVSSGELGMLLDMIREIPVAVIVTDEDGIPRFWKGIPVPDTARSAEALARVREIARQIDQTVPPREVQIPLDTGPPMIWTAHVAESGFLRKIALMPVVAAIVTLFFTSVALWGFWQIKAGEQQALWVGLAKETAHQLGTPLTSLSGWIEILAEEDKSRKQVLDAGYSVVDEMASDMDRLKKVAQRFSQVGSRPDLTEQHVTILIDETVEYFQTRIPRLGKDAAIERHYGADDAVPLNRDLLGWAFENILKNSLDALSKTERVPRIRISTERIENWFRILVEDNGKGASSKDLRKMFEPGYSTKKRGWGLGLTFVKRIVEDYHGGQVSAHSAGPDQGMIIDIRLPLES